MSFYETVPLIYHLSEITNAAKYRDIPDDWLIAITDVVNSTQAIKNGKYKDVNAVSAAVITAMLNAHPGQDLPFMFGGDGATILTPPENETTVRSALAATRQLAKTYFDLTLRAAIVPVRDVLARGYTIRVTRLYISDNFQESMFSGGGLGEAERLMKYSEKDYAIPEIPDASADFSGFECRWNEIPSPSEETISLLVTSNLLDVAARNRVYQDTIQQLEAIYGDYRQRHPLTLPHMQVGRRISDFKVENKIRRGDGGLRRALWLMIYAMLGKIKWSREGIWESYKEVVLLSTDNEKFDDTLRMTIAGTRAQREELTRYLEMERQRGNLIYGIYVGERALMTCLVFDRFGRQVHFVDSAGGGYALAAQQMKSQVQTIPVLRLPPEDGEA